MVERIHWMLKVALRCNLARPWLPAALLSMHTTFKKDLQASPAQMVCGTLLRTPSEFFVPQDTYVDFSRRFA